MYKLFCVLFILFHSAFSFFVTVSPNVEECFFDRIKPEMDMLFLYEVAEGGSLDIDAKVIDPNGVVLYSAEKKSDDKFTFRTKTDGIYKYCFSNTMSSVTNKILMFSLDIVSPQHTDSTDSHSKLEDMVIELDKALTTVKHEQEYMETREKIHRKVNENTNSRVLLWAVFEACILVVMSAGQVYYLKRFFEVRRVV